MKRPICPRKLPAIKPKEVEIILVPKKIRIFLQICLPIRGRLSICPKAEVFKIKARTIEFIANIIIPKRNTIPIFISNSSFFFQGISLVKS